MRFAVSCNSARQRGAIGIFYPIAEDIEAETPEEAENAYREKYETCGPPVVVKPVPREE